MFTCLEITENVTEYLEGSLGLRGRIMFRWHLLFCRPCRIYVMHVRTTIGVLGNLEFEGPSQAIEAELLNLFRG